MDEPLPRARFLVERCPAPGETVRLSGEEIRHARARRLAAGEVVVLVDGSGREARGRLVELSRSGARVAVESVVLKEDPTPVLDLLVAGLRLERLSWVVEKATELGVSRVVVVASALTQAQRVGAASLERLGRVARQAAKQCESARWPAIEGPVPFARAIGTARGAERLLLDFEGTKFPQRLSGPVSILVGPEGGWTDSERTAARDEGWSAVALPAGKLRAETAAVAGVVLARAALARDPGNARR